MKLKTRKRSTVHNLELRASRKVPIKITCPDTINCFAIGMETDVIKQYFNGFDNFKLIVGPVIKMGAQSENGFIQKIHYKKNNYNAYTVLKSSLRSRADNLYYEYLIGQKINTYNKFVPSFIETYSIYQYQDKLLWDVSKKNDVLNNIHTEQLFSSLKNISGNPELTMISESCERPKYIAIMLQYIKTTKKFKYFMMERHFNRFLILPVIFQIYATLYTLRNVFTHYDLHYENIILYEPKPNTYIEYHYHVGDKIISFKSPFMVKIIDYGRSYFGVGGIRDELCKICDECGEDVGYGWLYFQKNDPQSYYITPRFLNKSADLRLLYDIKRKVNPTSHLKKMTNIKFACEYGTPEDLTFKRGEIRNINDAFETISKIMVLSDVLKDNETGVWGMKKFGDLEIFTDMSQEMRFTKAQN